LLLPGSLPGGSDFSDAGLFTDRDQPRGDDLQSGKTAGAGRRAPGQNPQMEEEGGGSGGTRDASMTIVQNPNLKRRNPEKLQFPNSGCCRRSKAFGVRDSLFFWRLEFSILNF